MRFLNADPLATTDVNAETDDEFEQRVHEVSCLRDPDRLAGFSDDEQDAVRTAVAKNEHTPVEVLEAMAADPSNRRADGVLVAIGQNEQASDELLRTLAATGSTHVRHAIWFTERVRDVFTTAENAFFSTHAWRMVVVSHVPLVIVRVHSKCEYPQA